MYFFVCVCYSKSVSLLNSLGISTYTYVRLLKCSYYVRKKTEILKIGQIYMYMFSLAWSHLTVASDDGKLSLSVLKWLRPHWGSLYFQSILTLKPSHYNSRMQQFQHVKLGLLVAHNSNNALIM